MTALVGAVYLPTHYGFYYMGVVELSSIPLTAFNHYERACEIASSNDEVTSKQWESMRRKRDTLKAISALGFLIMRAFDFTRVTACKFVPDALQVLRSPLTAASFYGPLRFMLVSSICFVGLQLYWFSVLVRIFLTQRAREAKKKARKKKSSSEEM
ncbi:MAG: hypothetical protein SGPRY_011837 [Prymnesium sp.]